MTKTAPKSRNTDRHRPGYFREYMRKYRAKKKAEAAKVDNTNQLTQTQQ